MQSEGVVAWPVKRIHDACQVIYISENILPNTCLNIAQYLLE